MDGSGYPQCLKGEAIILEPRTMALADGGGSDVFVPALPPGLGIEATLTEIERGRGNAYDPIVADAC